jgi:DNA-binding CsgD family transcriptional regulator
MQNGRCMAQLGIQDLHAMTRSEEPVNLLQLVDAVSDCVPAIGTDGFIEHFLLLVSKASAVQVTAFAYSPTKVECLLSRNFLSEAKGGALAAAYLDGWFRNDPVFDRLIAMNGNQCIVERLEDMLPAIDSKYLAKFFDKPGFRTKTTVLVTRDPFRMALNLYYDKVGDLSLDAAQAAIYRLVGTMLATHFIQLKHSEFPLPLTVLSDRERQVCIGMLEGKKAEIIAQEIGVGPSSVLTYRQRAYQKLGISSRGQLFSICRSWQPTHVGK